MTRSSSNAIWLIVIQLYITPLFSQQLTILTPRTNMHISYPTFGISGGFIGTYHDAEFSAIPDYPTCCPEFRAGYGLSFEFNTFFSIPITLKIAAQLNGGLSIFRGSLIRREDNASILQPDGSIITGIIEHRLRTDIEYITVSPTIRVFPLSAPLYFLLGPKIGYTVSNSFSYEEVLVQPSNVSFENGSPVRNQQSGSIHQITPWFTGITIGSGYSLPLSRTIRLTPEISYTYPLTTVIQDSLWKVHGLQLTIGIAIPLIPKQRLKHQPFYLPDITPIPLREVELPKPPPPKLAFSFDVYGEYSDGALEKNPSIILEEQELRETFPLLPKVFFPQGNTSLERTRQILLTASETNSFSPQLLPADALEIYKHLLNIIGYRMRQNPKTTITLSPVVVTSPDRVISRDIAMERATKIKDYLTTVWGISPNRISTRAIVESPPPPSGYEWFNDLWEELERVDITTNDDALLLPVEIRHVTRSIYPQALLLFSTVESEVGIKHFTFRLSNSNRDTLIFRGRELKPRDTLRWQLRPTDFLNIRTDSVIITGIVIDKAEQRRSQRTALPFTTLTVDIKRKIGTADTLFEKYSLILFAFDKAELGPRNMKIIDLIAQRIKPNSRLTILGYTDRIGDFEYNKKLAEARCLEVFKALRTRGVRTEQMRYEAVGSEKLLYDNNLPEGRNYSRTVQILITTPLQPN